MSVPERQNALMRVPDRQLAIATLRMNDDDLWIVFDVLSGPKHRRVMDERQYQKRLSIREKDLQVSLGYVMECLVKSRPALKSYIRP